jgi:hypothetical protein
MHSCTQAPYMLDSAHSALQTLPQCCCSPSWLPMLTQPGRTLCGRAKISSLRVPGDKRSRSGYISSGLRLVSRTSAITMSQSTCLS